VAYSPRTHKARRRTHQGGLGEGDEAESPRQKADRCEGAGEAHAVREAGLKYLNEGDELTFEVENGEKGPSAVNLQKS